MFALLGLFGLLQLLGCLQFFQLLGLRGLLQQLGLMGLLHLLGLLTLSKHTCKTQLQNTIAQFNCKNTFAKHNCKAPPQNTTAKPHFLKQQVKNNTCLSTCLKHFREPPPGHRKNIFQEMQLAWGSRNPHHPPRETNRTVRKLLRTPIDYDYHWGKNACHVSWWS